MTMRIWLKAKLTNRGTELGKPCSGYLLAAIKSLSQATSFIRWMIIAKKSFHIHLFWQIPIEKSILDICLKHFPLVNSSNNDKASNWGETSYWGKCLLIINVILMCKDFCILMCKDFCHKSGFVMIYRSICMSLDFVDPFATNHRLFRG